MQNIARHVLVAAHHRCVAVGWGCGSDEHREATGHKAMLFDHVIDFPGLPADSHEPSNLEDGVWKDLC
jgi:hypothetical protein